MLFSILALLVSTGTGWCLLHLCAGVQNLPWLLRAVLSCGIGLVANSILMFCCLMLGIADPVTVMILDACLFAGAIALWLRAQPAIEAKLATATTTHRNGSDRAIALATSVAVAASAFASLLRYRAEPLGFWDGFAIWNLKAKFFYFAGGAHWERAFSDIITWSHNDYPFLLPAGVARLWNYAGGASTAAPAVFSLVFFLLSIALAYGALRQLAGERAAGLCALALLASPAFAGQAVWQVADIPLAFYLLGAVCLLLLAKQEGAATTTLTRLAGFFAGAGALTKNEGLLFALAIVVVLAAGARKKNESSESSDWLAFAQGAAGPLFVLAIMKLGYAGESDLAADFGVHSLARLLEVGRHTTIMASFGQTLLVLAGWPLLVVLAGVALWSRFAATTGTVAGLPIAAAILAIQLLGYYGVYLVTERDLAWHLGTSNLRLFVQLWPSFLVLFFAQTAAQASAGVDASDGA
ncbi:MAG: glycosyltransferase family 39 protein [Myxococcota bacterium]|jgi:hypothetical protein|nr:glycosyltransferase family 39 protein [Myxococcota bacterium]